MRRNKNKTSFNEEGLVMVPFLAIFKWVVF